MEKYIVNTNGQSNGDHEVHNASKGCLYMPFVDNQMDLGYHKNCWDAVSKAKTYYQQVNGCFYCCKECHTQ